MEIKIGIQHSPREIVVDANDDVSALEAAVAEAVTQGTLLSLTDAKGRKVFIPGSKLAYVEIGSSTVGQVGFRS